MDVYGIVTERILNQLEAGTVPWRRPWRIMDDGWGHRNLESKRAYRGINQLLLQLTEYEQPWWVTFAGAKRLGGSLMKDEKSTLVTFFKILEPKNEAKRTKRTKKGEPKKERGIPLLRYYKVFNVEQCEGLDEHVPEPEPEPETVFDPVARCERIVSEYPAPAPPVKHGGNEAFYSPTSDVVGIPKREAFDGAEPYYAVLFHELTHSTGHQKRLKRPLDGGVMRSESYSKEELIAEIGATMLCAVGDLEPDYETRSAYLDSWRSALTRDKRLIVGAANKAQHAADYILGRTNHNDKED